MSNLPISKCLMWLGSLALGLLVVLGLEPSIALAAVDHAADSTAHTFTSKVAGDGGAGKGAAFVFWIFALCSIGGAIFVITRRNMVTAVMGMVGTFFAIAGLYLMLYASFLAVMQVLVYAGAIMVLFVFVIMILNRPEDEPWAVHGLLGKGVAALGLLYLFKRLAGILWQVKDTHPLILVKDKLDVEVVLNHSDPELLKDLGVASIKGLKHADVCQSVFAVCRDNVLNHTVADTVKNAYEFGSIEGVGYTLFSKYLFPFEAVSIVLLVAVVGAIAIARPDPNEPDVEEGEAAKEAS